MSTWDAQRSSTTRLIIISDEYQVNLTCKKAAFHVTAIGPRVSIKSQAVSGQAMMFELLLRSLAEQGCDVKVFDILGQESQGQRRSGSSFSWARVREYVRVLPRLWVHLLRKPSIVYLTSAQSFLGFLRDAAVIWPAAVLGRPLVTHQFGGNYSEFFRRQLTCVQWLIRRTLARVNTIIVEGDLVKNQFSFLPEWETKVQTIPNGLPERCITFPLVGKTLQTSTAPFQLLYLSNMIETKGYWDVLESVRILVKERKRCIHCLFVGKFLVSTDATRFVDSMVAKRSFNDFIETNGLSNVVTYNEVLFGQQKADAFTRAHVFLLPSNYVNEGQPVSVLEAMAHGVPVIATPHRLIPMMVEQNRTGFLVAYNSPKEIADRVEFLIDHAEVFQNMSQESINRFQRYFSAERYIEKLHSLLNSQES